MSIGFRKDKSVGNEARRIGCRRVEKILGTLEDGHSAKGIHDARKGIKELRALLRLVRCGLAREDYRHYADRLRTVSSRLSGSRDAHVVLTAFDKLAEKAGDALPPESHRRIRRQLQSACEKQDAGIPHPGKTLSRALHETSDAFESLELDDSGWAVLGSGLKRVYRDGRRALAQACESNDAVDFHEWRKRVKDLYYQSRLLCRLFPRRMKKLTGELEKIGKWLGDDHDLCMLLESPALRGAESKDRDHLGGFRALAEKRQQRLRSQAVKLGRKVYKEKPSAFCKRLEREW